MRKFYLIMSIIILLAAAYLIIVNLNNYQPVHYCHSTEIIDGHRTFLYRMMNIASYTALVLFSGIISGAGIVYSFLGAAKDKIKAYERELEKTSVTGQNNASKVEVLEAKIQTLEKAFNTVIEERSKLETEIKSLNTELENLKKNNSGN